MSGNHFQRAMHDDHYSLMSYTSKSCVMPFLASTTTSSILVCASSIPSSVHLNAHRHLLLLPSSLNLMQLRMLSCTDFMQFCIAKMTRSFGTTHHFPTSSSVRLRHDQHSSSTVVGFPCQLTRPTTMLFSQNVASMS